MIFITCLCYLSSSSADDKRWGRDAVYKCDEGYTVLFHLTEHVNEVVLLKDDVIISSQSNPHQDHITSLDGISITSTDLTDHSELTAMTEQQKLRKYIENASYSFLFENPLFGKNKDKPRFGIVISNLSNYKFINCFQKK